MKRVCVFCETWSSGGIESFLCRLLSRMDKTELHIDLVTAQERGSVFKEELSRSGIRLRQLSGSKSRWIANCRAFARLLREEHYDVVHINAFQGLQLIYLWLAKRAGVPVRIAHSHGSDLRKSRLRSAKLLLHRLGRLLFGHCATERWACSAQAAEFLFGSMSARFIPGGIDTERFRFRPDTREAVRRTLGLEDRFVIGCVGRLLDDKNHRFLLDVLAELLPHRPESVLLLVGEGAEEQELRQKADALGISDRVIFYGTSRHVETLFWAMDAFAFPSLSEGLGLALIEAQAAGLPSVCSRQIPREADLTPLIRRLPLENGPDPWVRALLTVHGGHRESCADAVRAAGFDAASVAATVRGAYLG